MGALSSNKSYFTHLEHRKILIFPPLRVAFMSSLSLRKYFLIIILTCLCNSHKWYTRLPCLRLQNTQKICIKKTSNFHRIISRFFFGWKDVFLALQNRQKNTKNTTRVLPLDAVIVNFESTTWSQKDEIFNLHMLMLHQLQKIYI